MGICNPCKAEDDAKKLLEVSLLKYKVNDKFENSNKGSTIDNCTTTKPTIPMSRANIRRKSLNPYIENTDNIVMALDQTNENMKIGLSIRKCQKHNSSIHIPNSINDIKLDTGDWVESKRNVHEDYKILEVIGKGSFGEVSRAVNIRTGKVYAIKTIEKSKDLENGDIMNEIEILKTLVLFRIYIVDRIIQIF